MAGIVTDDELRLLANIGDSMIDDGHKSVDLDREKVGLLLIQLNDPRGSEKQGRAKQSGHKLSKYAIHFIEHVSSASYSYLFEVRIP